MKNYRITIKIEIPAPREFTYNIAASSAATAISRAMKQLRKDLGRPKVIKEWRVHALVA